jgi:hypothetical protein
MSKTTSRWIDSEASASQTLLEADGAGGSSFQNHEELRQLIHFIDDGPTVDTGSSIRMAITGTVFPTAVTWYHTVSMVEHKLVEKLITWTGTNPTTIVWNMYDDTGSVIATVTDTITYSTVFETGRTRVYS